MLLYYLINRKIFLDAIPMTGTPASLKMLTQLLVSDEVSGIEAEMWLTTLAFVQTPTVEMLAEIKVSFAEVLLHKELV